MHFVLVKITTYQLDIVFPKRISSLTLFRHVFLPQPIYGFTSGGPLRFKRAVGHKDLFYIDDKDLDFKDVRN